MINPTFSNPTIPRGSTVLVTGANGLIASHAVDRLLEAGYHVRGTVRNPSKCAWMAPLFSRRHPSARFELVQVSDFGAPGAWDAAVKGVSAVVAVAGGVGLVVPDVDKALEEEAPWNEALLRAAKDEPSVKAFIYTSSAWATWTPDQTKKVTLTEWTWNDEAVRFIRSGASASATPEERGVRPYMAVKALLEQRLWDWVKRENPPFTFNTVLPAAVIGECLDPENQGVPSTCGMMKDLYERKQLDFLAKLPPQWASDTRDTGLLYVAALITPGVDRERLYPWSDRYSWPRVAQILKKLYPHKDIPVLEDNGWDQTEVPNKRAEELLRGLGQERWTTLEESVEACAKAFVKD
ncbi:NAD(P)-binding protein [Daldinia caldariorum]|uniref:NAD(P)-binding protein n=1 Tax=Daldinia caldariorum TaxID=326644 RepID=UPI0020081BD8|nr:NAD(P)-binding protein [Daldinia caldariorum]KAI1472589.1 NAD(P)-binding protein [Daldinia caldariorum]